MQQTHLISLFCCLARTASTLRRASDPSARFCIQCIVMITSVVSIAFVCLSVLTNISLVEKFDSGSWIDGIEWHLYRYICSLALCRVLLRASGVAIPVCSSCMSGFSRRHLFG